MLKTSNTKLAKPGKDVVGVGGSSKTGRNGSRSRIDDSEVDGDKIEDDEIRKKVQKLSKSKNLSKSKKMVRSDFFTPKAKLAFIKLRQAILKALILYHFDPEHHIQIKTDALGYAIGKVFS